MARTGLGDTAGDWQYFSLAVPTGQTSLTILMSGGTGDADLYVKLGAQPGASSYDQRPYLDGNAESVSISNPAAGTYYIGINAYQAYASVSLKATYTAPSGGGGTDAGFTEVEPNNSRTGANVVSAAGTIKGTIGSSGDSDYFKLSAPAGKTLGANLTVPQSVDVHPRLYNSSGAVIARSENKYASPSPSPGRTRAAARSRSTPGCTGTTARIPRRTSTSSRSPGRRTGARPDSRVPPRISTSSLEPRPRSGGRGRRGRPIPQLLPAHQPLDLGDDLLVGEVVLGDRARGAAATQVPQPRH